MRDDYPSIHHNDQRQNAVRFFLALFFLALAVSGIVFYLGYRFALTPMAAQGEPVLITVRPGQGLSATAQKLSRENLISSANRFRILAALTGRDKKIKAGEYRFDAAMPPWAMLQDLSTGKVYLHRVTIPEGYSLYQIGQALQAAGICDEGPFVTAATDPVRVRKAAIAEPAETFEGYLFPDTYHFARKTNPDTVIDAMVSRLRSVFKSIWFERSKELGLSLHEVLTLASIIEKETGAADERPLISSVFHNRLAKNMRLETDPTVIYGIKDFDGNLTREHLRTRTPYNTYKRKGLPPGPIANPGLKAIEAALYPEDSPYLYFVSRKDGTHQFSANIRDHINAVRKYQLRR
ncbi:endolytic transglycosylase MltG [Desulfatiferula olefinivorans]